MSSAIGRPATWKEFGSTSKKTTARGEAASRNQRREGILLSPVRKCIDGYETIEFHATRASLSQTDSRSEEHTSELQSLTNLVCRLLLEKKKKNQYII